MGIVVRQSIKSVMVTMGGALMGVLVVVLSIHFFPKGEYGFTQNLIKIALQISYLGVFGFNYTLLVYGQRFAVGHEARGTFLSLASFFPFCFSVLIFLLYFVFKDKIISLFNAEDAQMMEQYFILFPLLTFFSSLIGWFDGYLQSLHKTALQHFVKEILARIIYIILILLYALGWIDFSTFIWLYVITYLIQLGFLLWIALRNKGFVFSWRPTFFSKKDIKEILRFSGYHMLTVVSTVFLLQIDAFLLAPLDSNGFEAVAVYSVAALAVSILRNPTRAIGLAAMPTFTQTYNAGDLKTLEQLFKRSAINMQIIGLGLFLLILVNLDNIGLVMNLIQEGYGQVQWLIVILMLGQVMDLFTGLNFELIGVTKYYRFNFWIAIVLLFIVITLGYFWIKDYGVYGAAWATTVGLFVFNIAKTIFLQQKMQMQPFHRETLLIVCSGILLATLVWFIPTLPNVFIDLLVRCLVFCLAWWAVLYRIKVSPDLNTITKTIIEKRRLY